jgi:hypothetical protein
MKKKIEKNYLDISQAKKNPKRTISNKSHI